MGNAIVFGILAFIAVAAALLMVTSRNAIHSALYLVVNFCTVAVFYLVLNAPFISMVQITVYAGAIVVLFLFVIMLLGAERLPGASAFGRGWQFWGAMVLILGLLGALLTQMTPDAPQATLPPIDASPEAIGMLLFESYVFPFEVTSILLLVAMMSLVVWQSQKKGKKK